jgi:SAM-dependent methyltransferase
MTEGQRLYDDFADWWPVMSDPADYDEEAALYREALEGAASSKIRDVLELGSGGGNNASHLKAHYRLTLVDRSAGMLEVSRALNPECEHVVGDMRTVRLGREFDAVFVHDAIGYMATEEDLRAALETAFVHTKPGGVALFVPDFTKECFEPRAGTGGHDRGERSMRYLEWTFDPDPEDETYTSAYAYMFRDGSAPVRTEYEEHVMGLVPHATWIRLIDAVGFEPRTVACPSTFDPPREEDLFLGLRPG